jgi:hypothetical protein
MRKAIVPVILAVLSMAIPALASMADATPFSNQVLIPVAGSVAGANGTYFRSDIRVTNLREVSQRVYLQWVPRNGGPVPAGISSVTIVDIAPHQTLASDDFVREIMNRGDLGAIWVKALDAAGELDPAGRLNSTSRVWTPQPGTSGTTSQSLPSIALSDVVSEHLAIIGGRRNEKFRTNIGIVNLDATGTHRFRVTVSGENPTVVPEIHLVDVPALGLVQLPLDGVPQNNLRIDVEEDLAPGQPRLTLWTAYSSTVDNVTGDGWANLGFEVDPK